MPQARSRLQHASTMRTSVPLLSTTSKGRHRAQAAFRRILAICAVALAAVGLVGMEIQHPSGECAWCDALRWRERIRIDGAWR